MARILVEQELHVQILSDDMNSHSDDAVQRYFHWLNRELVGIPNNVRFFI